MISIYKRVKQVLSSYKGKSSEFQEGMKLTLELFKIGIEKHPQFNIMWTNRLLLKRNEALENELRQYKNLLTLRDDILYMPVPSDNFTEYEINFKDNITISIVSNLDEIAMKVCVMSFKIGDTSNTVAEFKNRLLWFINSKNSKGFYAFKNLKQAKENFKK